MLTDEQLIEWQRLRVALKDIITTCELGLRQSNIRQCRACGCGWKDRAEPEHAVWCPARLAREALAKGGEDERVAQ